MILIVAVVVGVYMHLMYIYICLCQVLLRDDNLCKSNGPHVVTSGKRSKGIVSVAGLRQHADALLDALDTVFEEPTEPEVPTEPIGEAVNPCTELVAVVPTVVPSQGVSADQACMSRLSAAIEARGPLSLRTARILAVQGGFSGVSDAWLGNHFNVVDGMVVHPRTSLPSLQQIVAVSHQHPCILAEFVRCLQEHMPLDDLVPTMVAFAASVDIDLAEPSDSMLTYRPIKRLRSEQPSNTRAQRAAGALARLASKEMTCKRHADKLLDVWATTGHVRNNHPKKPRNVPPPVLPIADAVGLLASEELQDPTTPEATVELLDPMKQGKRLGKHQVCTIEKKLEVLRFIARNEEAGVKNAVTEAMIALPERLSNKSQVTRWRRAARQQNWELLPPSVQRCNKEVPNYLRKKSGT